MSSPLTPEQQAREQIDAMLVASGWVVQDRAGMNLSAGLGVAVREFPLATGEADYLLFVNGKAVGALEAKKAGHTLKGVEVQSGKYAGGLPAGLNPPVTPLPFLYESTGVETQFTNLLDPDPRSRTIFAIHRPETLAEWLAADTLDAWVRSGGHYSTADDTRPSSLRSRLRALPPLEQPREGSGWRLYPNQLQGIVNLERSLQMDKPRALIQMATGSGKTIMAVTAIYRMIKFGGARRILFLVDRTNLGEQAEKEFQNYRTPDDNRKFTELYKVQRLTSNSMAASSKVVLTTVQRLYSMLQGEPDLDPALEEVSRFELDSPLKPPLPVTYRPDLPPETYDVVFVDECHRSIYTLWRQVLEYFDGFLVGLTATPAKHTFGFFHQNLVMEYRHEEAVADGVNVDFEVYRIRTRITEDGSTVEKSPLPILGVRNRSTRAVRWEAVDQDLTYTGDDLDRSVVAKDQIRTVIRAFRDRLFVDLFPGRTEVPKTLVFCKDDSHAEDVVDILREEFGRGNSFAQKITYKTTGKRPADLLQEFRISYEPRVAVTVDMVSTGTDIRSIEIVLFLRSIKSRVLFEQMKGRGVRIIDANELRAVTPDATAKTHFVLVDAVGLTDHADFTDTHPLECQKHVSTRALLDYVAMGGTAPDALSSLASRLARLGRVLDHDAHRRLEAVSGGVSLWDLCRGILEALDLDRQVEAARCRFYGSSVDAASRRVDPTEAEITMAAEALAKAAVAPLASNPGLRQLILELKARLDQVLDEVSKDELVFAGASQEAKDKARSLVTSFEAFLAGHRDEIDALQFFYSQPYSKRLRYTDLKALAEAIQAPPRSWTPEVLWRAYELLEKDKVRGASGRRLLTDIVSLVRFALHQQPVLEPFGEQVRVRFQNWMAGQEMRGRRFTPEPVRWLEMMRDHVAANVEIEVEDFDLNPFAQEGGLGAAARVFGGELGAVMRELNEALAA